MKHIWKVVFMTLGILAGIGMVCLAVGAALGGADQAVRLLREEAGGRRDMDREDAVRWMETVEAEDWPEQAEIVFPVDGARYEDLEVADREQIQCILIRAESCELTIEETERNFYGIIAENMDGMQYFTEEDSLVIVAQKDQKSSGINSRLTLYIPRAAAIQTMEMELGAGRFCASNLITEYLDLESGAGNFILEGLKAGQAEIELGAGRLEIRDGEVTDLVIEAGMGDLSYQGSILGNVKAECAMGAIHLLVAGDEEAYNYRTECAAGSIQVGTEGRNLSFGEHTWTNNGAMKGMELSCMMGRIEVGFYENGGNVYEQ